MNSLTDYTLYILFKIFGFLVRLLPFQAGLFLGRRIGDLLCFFDRRRRALVYSNIKCALGRQLPPCRLKKIVAGFYRAFGQNIMELFYIPAVDAGYFNKYITVEGKEHIFEAFKKGKGVIISGVHEGSWEFSNIISANLGFQFYIFAREQRKYPRLYKLLNDYREKKGCRIVQAKEGVRGLIRALRDNKAIGVTADQGGKNGMLVKFFGKNASMPIGAITFALRYGAELLPAFYARIKGPYIKVVIHPPLQLRETGDHERDLRDNLQKFTGIFEEYIRRYPHEYLWSYKIWKYSDQRTLLILDDGKTGHLRQSQAVAKLAGEHLRDKGIKLEVKTVRVSTRGRFSSLKILISGLLAGKYSCQGCLWCLKGSLDKESYEGLVRDKFDIVVSSGSGLAALNYILSRENLAKSVAVLKPSVLGFGRFDLVVMPRHDKPARRKTVVVTDGALNLIDKEYLERQGLALVSSGTRVDGDPRLAKIGLLLGGDTKNFFLSVDIVREVIRQIKSVSEKMGAQLLVTTSRRTSPAIEKLVKGELSGYPLCRLLVIANEKNIPEAVGGILGLSDIIIVSPESISMVSEAASSAKYVLVFDCKGLRAKHRSFLANLRGCGIIRMVDPSGLSAEVEALWSNKPEKKKLEDNSRLKTALEKIL